MRVGLGIDLGTSGLKVVAVDEAGRILDLASAAYPTTSPETGWAEQAPEAWHGALRDAAAELWARGRVRPEQVAGIGLSGQMHGTVLLEASGRAVRPAIIWSDGRAAAEVREIDDAAGVAVLRIAGNRAATGFAAPTLRWLRGHEPASLNRARWAVQPKDAVRAGLTGSVAGEVTDASGTLLLDVSTRSWSTELCDALDIDSAMLPPLLESGDVAGELTAGAAAELGVPAGLPVAAGAGDALAAALGLGIAVSGSEAPGPGADARARAALVMLGTGAQVQVPARAPLPDAAGRLNTFCHAVPGEWCCVAAILSGAAALDWVLSAVGAGEHGPRRDALLAAAARVAPGSGGVLFHPYLVGERTPLMDPSARGAFTGIRAEHDAATLVRAVTEGVALALGEGLRLLRETGAAAGVSLAVVAGGGARSALWRRILADVLRLPIAMGPTEHASARGAALLGGVAGGIFPSIGSATEAAARGRRIVAEPDPARAAMYEERAAAFRESIPSLPRGLDPVRSS